MTQTTARPAQLAPVRIGKGVRVHLGHLSSIKGPNGEPRYGSWCPASRGRDGVSFTAGEAVAEAIDCRSCQRQASTDAMERAAATAAAMIQAAHPTAPAAVTALAGPTGGHDLDTESARVLAAIPAWGTATPEGLATRAGLDLRTVLRRLSLLEPAGLVRRQEDGVARAVTLNREYDHHGQCIGCGATRLPTVTGAADGEDYWCLSTCGFRTGTISPAMILRAAVRHLEHFPRGHGADVRAALDAGAVALIRTEDTRGAGEDLDVEDLVEPARDALAAYFDEITAGPGDTPGADLVDEYGATVPRHMLATTLHLAADRVTREQLLGEGLRELERCCPGDEMVLLTLTGSVNDPQEIYFLGTSLPCWVDEADETAFTKAGELIVRALKISLPYYLRATGDGSGATHELRIADTTHGRALRQ